MSNQKLTQLTAVTSLAKDDLLYIVTMPSSTSKKVTVGLLRDYYNVKDYGATGNGSTDDTTYIHDARDAAGVGSTLFFPPGTYKTTGLAANVASQTWPLARGATIKMADAANTSCVVVTANGFTLCGQGKLDGNAANQSGTWGSGTYTGAGVKASAVSDLTIEGIEITNTKFNGIDVFTATNVVVHRCYIHAPNMHCLHIRDVTGMTCTDNHFYNWARAFTGEGSDHDAAALSMYLTSTGSRNLNISGNRFRNTDAIKYAIESAGVWSAIVCDSIISNNIFDSNAAAGGGISGVFFRTAMTGNVHVNGCGNYRSGYEIIGTDNIIAQNIVEEGRISIVSAAGGTTARCKVQGNIVSAVATNGKGIDVGGSLGAVTDIDIAENTITVSGTGSVHGINVGSVGTPGELHRIRVHGNSIKDGTENADGVSLTAAVGSTDIEISGNTVRDCYHGVYVTADDHHSEVTITDNDLRGQGAGGSISNNATGGYYRIYQNLLADAQVIPATVTDLATLITALAAVGIVVDGT